MASKIDKIRPNDERTKSCYIPNARNPDKGRPHHYLDSRPEGPWKATIMLVHGFPDISFGWRYQIPFLMKKGYRVLALDCMGYGKTGYSYDLSDYTFFAHADAIAAIAKATNTPKLILGGHDWGGATVYRVAQWYPDLISGVFSIATPYSATSRTFSSSEDLVANGLTNFGYQLQFGSEEGVVENAVGDDKEKVRMFLQGMYSWGAKGQKPFMTPEHGVDLEMLEKGEVGETPFLDEEELAFYTTTFATSPLRGPFNWYRTRLLNFRDELALPENQRNRIPQPVLFVQAAKDNVLTPAMSRGMERFCPDLTRAEVPTGHWALWQAPERVNEIVGEWLDGLEVRGEGGKSRL